MKEVFRELDESYAEGLTQPYPTIVPRTIFKSFDYVGKPYADFLDSFATIVIVWSASSIFLTCFLKMQGGMTRSIAMKDIVDRAVNVSTAPCFSFRKDAAVVRRPRKISNTFQKITAALAVLVLFGIQALIIFSQLSFPHYRELGELKLRRISLKVPSHNSNTSLDMKLGCTLLVQKHTGQEIIPVYYCYRLVMRTASPSSRKNRSEILYGVVGDRFFVIDLPYTIQNVTLRLRYSFSFELRDDHHMLTSYANLTMWSFNLSSTTVDWMTSEINEKAPLCNAKAILRNDSLYRVSVVNEHWSLDMVEIPSLLLRRMMQVSDSEMRVTDFLPDKSVFVRQVSTKPIGLTSTKVKRLSGLTAWLIAAVLEILRLALQLLSRDVTEEIDDMVAKALDMQSIELLRNSPNIFLEIVSQENVFSCNFDDGDDFVAQGGRLILQRKDMSA